MLRPRFAIALLLFLALAEGAAAEGVKLYPGATKYTPPETEQTKQFNDSLRPGVKITAYFTNDAFDKVVEFYGGIGKQFTAPKAPAPQKLPSGQELQKAFVIFDGAADLTSSNSWVRIQHPFIGSISSDAGQPEYHDIRDVTEIVVTEKKPREKSATQKPVPKKPPAPPRS